MIGISAETILMDKHINTTLSSNFKLQCEAFDFLMPVCTEILRKVNPKLTRSVHLM